MDCNGHRHDGNPCKNKAVKGRQKCRFHGGTQKRGIAHHSFQHGKFSVELPAQYAADYQAAIRDPEIHALTHEIGVIEARYRELLRRSATSDLGHIWIALQQGWQVFLDAADADRQRAQDAVERIMQRGLQDYLLWQNIQETTKTLATLRYQEHKRLLDLQTVMTEQQMLQMLGLIERALYEAATAHVDVKTARALLADAQTRVRRFVPHHSAG